MCDGKACSFFLRKYFAGKEGDFLNAANLGKVSHKYGIFFDDLTVDKGWKLGMRNELLDEFVERVRAESDILAVVSSYVSMKRKGNRYWGCCPFHQENTPSFSVVPDQGFFYCFGCHAGGNVFKFISMMENISYFEAIKLQAERLNIPMPQRQKSAAELAREQKIADLRKVHEMARDFFHNCLTRTSYGTPAKAYFAGRGISMETIEEFQLGYAPNAWDKLSAAFLKRGVKREFLLESGLAAERRNAEGIYDRFRNRVIIPIADERGHVAGFGGRVLDDSQPKYLNSPETLLFNKRRLLFGLDRSHRAIKQEGYAIVVEGYMDAISVYGAGVHNVVASLGTAFTAEQCKLLLRYAPEIYFCYDSDDAGQNATIRALSIVRETGAVVRVIVVPDGKDPDEFIRKHGADEFRALVRKALPLVEYRMQYVLNHTDYSNLEGKVNALTAMLPVLAGIQNAVELNAYITRIAQVLGIDEGAVRTELQRYQHHPGEPEPQAQRSVVMRRAVHQADDAIRRAGRIVLKAAWQDLGVLAHLEAVVPLTAFPNELQAEILQFLHDCSEHDGVVDDVRAAEVLSDEAAAELSRALVEETGGQETMEAYEDSVKMLRKVYLQRLYDEHSQKADLLQRRGDNGFLQELAESQRIKNEMDEL